MSKMFINNREISLNSPPYIIAELSANHNGSLERAKKLILSAKQSGADAIKLQSYSADTITVPSNTEDFMIRGGLWDGKNLYELYKQAEMPWEWHKPLFEYANEIGITIFSSPFDYSAVDLLEKLNAPAYKVASFEAVDLPLIRYIAKTGKPMIISTGMANEEEIAEAIDAAQSAGCSQLAILHCVSSYPALASDYNLRTISAIQHRFKVLTGLSDHTIDNITAITSIAMGAVIIEKHFTLDRNDCGADDSFSIQPLELAALCKDTKTAWLSLGEVNLKDRPAEQENMKYRRSLYFMSDLPAGTVLTAEHIRSIRPGFGLPPKFYDKIIGLRLKVDVVKHSPISWDYFNIEQ